MRFQAVQNVVPFELSGLPAGSRIERLTVAVGQPSAELILAKRQPGPEDVDLSVTFTPLAGPDDSTMAYLDIDGRGAMAATSGDQSRLCLQDLPSYVCLTAFAPDDDYLPRRTNSISRRPVLITLARAVSFAPDLTDKKTWRPVDEALPNR